MYKSPIEKIYGELQTQMVQEDENMVMKAIRKVGVNVDKYELIKALLYDRNQYTKGYEDGKNEILNKMKAEIMDTLYVDSLIFGELIDFKNGKISADDVIEEFNRVTRLEVLNIIDKCKQVESEDKG